jgi:4-alpha-glucanotransferase
MKRTRTSGVLLHPTCLPGRFGIGDLGPEAHSFVETLASLGQGLWQVLPLGPTGFGDSPYQCFSAFAGNPLLVSLDKLVASGWLEAAELAAPPRFPAREVDFAAVSAFKRPLLRRAASRFFERAEELDRAAFAAFEAAQAYWLADYALFAALKQEHGGVAWTDWPAALRDRQPEALAEAEQRLAVETRVVRFEQFCFFTQWRELRRHCEERKLRLLGDIPIFVAHDSADVWARRDLFFLDQGGRPTVVAGVPPDYFSATGQLWGNPLYRWAAMKRDGYAWWIERFRSLLGLVDLVRLDHFRGFEAYWEVRAAETTAIHGRWVKGPGAAVFRALEKGLGAELPIVAENLGVITPAVEALRARFGFPGMAILQFAFGGDPQDLEGFQPHNLVRAQVAYTGTHDNDTTVGWWTSGVGDTTRSAEEVRRERDYCRGYLGFTDDHEVHWALIRALFASVVDTAIVPLQDVLGKGSDARMNLPGRPAGNWRWRFEWSELDQRSRERFAELTRLYGRRPRSS